MIRGLGLGVAVGRAVDGATSLRAARRAEAVGFDSVWVSEDYFLRGAFSVAGGVAAVTERIAVGVGVVNPFTRHPALLAMEAAALDEISGGRATVGVGASIKPWIEDQMGIPYHRPLTRLAETAEVVHRLLRAETVEHAGVFESHGVALGFSSRPDLPVWVGAMGARGLRVAGEFGDGLLLSVLTSPGYVRYALGQASVGAAGRSGHVLRTAAYLPFALSADDGEAKASVKPFLAQMLGILVGDEPILTESGLSLEELADIKKHLADGDTPDQAVSDRVVDALAVAGDGPTCLGRLEAYAEAGLDEAVLFGVTDTPMDALVADAATQLDIVPSGTKEG